jgi:hypothetical protein
LEGLPSELTNSVKAYLESTSVSRYRQKFFEEVRNDLVQQIGVERFGKIKQELDVLFEARNRVLHHGDASNIDSTSCKRFRDIARELFGSALIAI